MKAVSIVRCSTPGCVTHIRFMRVVSPGEKVFCLRCLDIDDVSASSLGFEDRARGRRTNFDLCSRAGLKEAYESGWNGHQMIRDRRIWYPPMRRDSQKSSALNKRRGKYNYR